MNQTQGMKNKTTIFSKNNAFNKVNTYYNHSKSDSEDSQTYSKNPCYFNMNQSFNRLSQKVKRYSSHKRILKSKVRKMNSSPVYQTRDQSTNKIKENDEYYCYEQIDDPNNMLTISSCRNYIYSTKRPSISAKLKQTTSTQSQETNFGKRNSKELPKFVKNKLNNNSYTRPIKQKQSKSKNKQQSSMNLNMPSKNKEFKRIQIKDFFILKKLGQGKFGKVFLVKENNSNMVLAMKVLDKRKIVGSGLLNQFIRELKIQTFLQHPNIIKVYGFFDDVDSFYILLQAGCTHLYSLMENRTNFTQQETSFIIRNLLSGLNFIHKHNVLHRDIKPENVILIHGNVKLCDFGWAVNRKGKDQLRNTFCGTPLYLAPQLLLGQKYDQKVDLWAIGVLAYELLIGGSPFKIQSQQDLHRIVTTTVFYPNRAVSDEFKQFVESVLKKNPKQRKDGQDLLNMNFITNYEQFQTCERLCIS